MEQKAHGFDVWAQPMIQLRLPSLFNLRSDPFERAQHEAGDYVKWFVEHAFCSAPGSSGRGAASDEFPAVSTTAAPRLILGRTGDGETQESALEQLTGINRSWKEVDTMNFSPRARLRKKFTTVVQSHEP
jgi:hypothetical protein